MDMPQKFGLTIEEAAAAGPLGRTKIFDAIREGKLRALKCGRRTIILPADYKAFIENLPVKSVPVMEAAS